MVAHESRQGGPGAAAGTGGRRLGWFRGDDPFIWLCAGAVAFCLLMVSGLMGLILVRGMTYFWPAPVVEFEYTAPGASSVTLAGEIAHRQLVLPEQALDAPPAATGTHPERLLLKTGNRRIYGQDFRRIYSADLQNARYPEELTVFQRTEWGNLYGYLEALEVAGVRRSPDDALLQDLIARGADLRRQLRRLERGEGGRINGALEKLRLEERRLELDEAPADDARYVRLAEQRRTQQERYKNLEGRVGALRQQLERDRVWVRLASGERVEQTLGDILLAYRPNAMSLPQKLGFYLRGVLKFLGGEPREANTEGGIFPALFGTFIMVLGMSVLVTPFGVIAAIYLHENARQGLLTRLVRISVNNLAGVPSVVYGVFGLGFFVYFLGGSLDRLFYPEALPAPTFGTPGLIWASLTLGLLTVPVVIVATEEGLSRVPHSLREGSLALGATRSETLWRTVLPLTIPAMLTGLILAVARAAGEVAPLMLVGVVKLAPSLPVDGVFPYLHLERKFMHLGFHIYDVGFQSPNVEATQPLVYATTLVLVLLIVVLNLSAIYLRHRMREGYRDPGT